MSFWLGIALANWVNPRAPIISIQDSQASLGCFNNCSCASSHLRWGCTWHSCCVHSHQPFSRPRETCIFAAEMSIWLGITSATLAHPQADFTSTPECPVSVMHLLAGRLRTANLPFMTPSCSPHCMNSIISSAHLMSPSGQLRPPMDSSHCLSLRCPTLVVLLFQLPWVLKETIPEVIR